jgi:hypothetical protein
MRRVGLAVAADVMAVLLFVVLGRSSHDEATTLGGVLEVAAPFVIGVAAGWALTPEARSRPFRWQTGVGVWLATVVIGALLRWSVWDRSTALSFVLVAGAFLALFLVGWRLVVSGATRPRGEIRS